jgi:hypothetical protein
MDDTSFLLALPTELLEAIVKNWIKTITFHLHLLVKHL